MELYKPQDISGPNNTWAPRNLNVDVGVAATVISWRILKESATLLVAVEAPLMLVMVMKENGSSQ